jgi:hypothetical protein
MAVTDSKILAWLNKSSGTNVQQRLEELTPQMVKEIMQQMIQDHLGWLVIWGGLFGGLIGLVTAFLPFLWTSGLPLLLYPSPFRLVSCRRACAWLPREVLDLVLLAWV